MSRAYGEKPASIKKQISAGGVIFRNADNDIDVVLVSVNPVRKHGQGFLSNGVKNKTRWCLPKGLIDKDEKAETTALREAREETGLSGELIDKIGAISYWYFLKNENTRLHKTVHFYLMKYKSGSTDDHDHEVDDAVWLPIKEALKKITFKGERDILQKAGEMIEKREILR